MKIKKFVRKVEGVCACGARWRMVCTAHDPDCTCGLSDLLETNLHCDACGAQETLVFKPDAAHWAYLKALGMDFDRARAVGATKKNPLPTTMSRLN